MPVFFVPTINGVASDEQENAYARFAHLCRCAVPAPGRRIFSITYRHDGVQWTATVGETLHGISTRTKRVRGTIVNQDMSHSDPAMVLAIFPGPPCYRVVTDSGRSAGSRTGWENPFLAGEPDEVVYFSTGS